MVYFQMAILQGAKCVPSIKAVPCFGIYVEMWLLCSTLSIQRKKTEKLYSYIIGIINCSTLFQLMILITSMEYRIDVNYLGWMMHKKRVSNMGNRWFGY